MRRLFVSYASQDKPRVAQLVAVLEDAGWDVWWDDQLEAGSRFAEDIRVQLSQASAVIVVWSATSIASDWVADEAEDAKTQDKLVPVVIDSVAPPLGFRRLHTVNLVGWRSSAQDSRIQDLLDSLERFSEPIGRAASMSQGRNLLLVVPDQVMLGLYYVAIVAGAFASLRLFETTAHPECAAIGGAHWLVSCAAALDRQMVIHIAVVCVCVALTLRSTIGTWNMVIESSRSALYARYARIRGMAGHAYGQMILFAILFIGVCLDMIVYDQSFGKSYESVLLSSLNDRGATVENPEACATAGRIDTSLRDAFFDMLWLVMFGGGSVAALVASRRSVRAGRIALSVLSMIGLLIGSKFLLYGRPSLITDGFCSMRASYAFFVGLTFVGTSVAMLAGCLLPQSIRRTN